MMKKFTAVLLSFLLLAELCPSYAKETAPTLNISPQLGRVIQKPAVFGGKQLVLIEDAHDSIEAQKNIAAIINHLVAKKGVERVYEEGYEGAVPVEDFFGGLTAQAKQRAADFALQKMDIGGAEYARVFTEFDLQGADQIEMYRKNVRAYAQASIVSETIEKQIGEWQVLIRQAVKKLAPEADRWLRLKRQHLAGNISMLDYSKRVLDLAVSEKIDAVSQDLILRALSGHGDTAVLKNVSPELVFIKQSVWESAIEKKLLNADARQLWAAEKWLDSALRLSRLEVSQEEYFEIKSLLERIDLEKWMNHLFGVLNQTMALSKSWVRQLRFAQDFYDTAIARDTAFGGYLRRNPPKK